MEEDKIDIIQQIIVFMKWIGPFLALTSVLIGLYSIWKGTKLFKEIKRQSNNIDKQTIELNKTSSELNSVSNKMESQSKKLIDIYSSMSTKFIGKFPHQFGEIIELIKTTKKELVIVTDFPAYGCISNPSKFAEYINTLSNLLTVKKVKVTLICYNREKQLEYLKLQFNIKEPSKLIDMKDLKKAKLFAQEFNLPKLNTYNDLFEQLLNKNFEVFKLFEQKGQDVYQTGLHLPMFFWLIDESNQSIFSLYVHAKKSVEISFITEDIYVLKHLLDSAKAIKENNDKTKKKFDYSR